MISLREKVDGVAFEGWKDIYIAIEGFEPSNFFLLHRFVALTIKKKNYIKETYLYSNQKLVHFDI